MKRKEFARLAREYGFWSRVESGRVYVYKIKNLSGTPFGAAPFGAAWSVSSDRVAGMSKEEAEEVFVDLVIRERM